MYGKFFASTFTGSMFGSGVNVFAVWGYVIANTKPTNGDHGHVELNPSLLAATLGCSVEEVESAIEFLCSPDRNSRTKTSEGKRLIREGQFAYSVPNYGAYRAIRNDDERRAYERDRKREQRAGKRPEVSRSPSGTVPDSPAVSAQAEAEVEEYENTSPEQQDCSGLIASLPLVDGSSHPVTGSEAAQWAAAYPAVDVRGELLRMRAWLNANPKNRKTRRGINAFVVRWLDKQQNRAPRKNGADVPMVQGRDYV